MKTSFYHGFSIGFTKKILFHVDVNFDVFFDETYAGFDGELFEELFPKLLMKCLLIKNDKNDPKK